MADLFFAKESVDTGMRMEAENPMTSVKFEETVKAMGSVEWKPLDLSKIEPYDLLNQGTSLSCVAHSRALQASIMLLQRLGKKIKLSAAFIYRQRKNLDGGMYAEDSFDIISRGVLPYEFLPFDGGSEGAINDLKIQDFEKVIASGLQADRKIVLPAGDFDALISTMAATNKPISVWFLGTNGDWGLIPGLSRRGDFGHAVLAIPPKDAAILTWGTLPNGEKAFVMQDSWDLRTSDRGLRIITEKFYRARNIYADYFMRFKFYEEDATEKPKYDGTIASLQDCLKREGLFPMNIASTGYLGNVTRAALMTFQKKYSIPQTGYVGPLTRAKLLEIYG